jgi:hypothetical protein
MLHADLEAAREVTIFPLVVNGAYALIALPRPTFRRISPWDYPASATVKPL